MPPTKETHSIPSKVQDFIVLPLHLPPQPLYPSKNAQHYLYLRRDAPKPGDEPTADVKRSLFIANLPIDATEDNLRRLFKDICGVRVERVDFDELIQAGQRRGLVLGGEMVVQGTLVKADIGERGGRKKRKRGGVGEEEVVKRRMEEIALPSVWERSVLRGGGCCVVVFVDESSKEVALKECGRVKRKGRVVGWSDSEGEVELGLQRKSAHDSFSRGERERERDSLLILR